MTHQFKCSHTLYYTQLTKSMGGVVKGLDKVMQTMDLEKVKHHTLSISQHTCVGVPPDLRDDGKVRGPLPGPGCPHRGHGLHNECCYYSQHTRGPGHWTHETGMCKKIVQSYKFLACL